MTAGRDYWSKYELGWHIAPTANQHDAIAAVELALTERDEQGNVVPQVTSVTDNGGPFRSFWSASASTEPGAGQGVHRHPPRAAARPHPGQDSRAERLT